MKMLLQKEFQDTTTLSAVQLAERRPRSLIFKERSTVQWVLFSKGVCLLTFMNCAYPRHL